MLRFDCVVRFNSFSKTFVCAVFFLLHDIHKPIPLTCSIHICDMSQSQFALITMNSFGFFVCFLLCVNVSIKQALFVTL